MQKKLYRIPPEANYLKTLADFISAKCPDPLEISASTLILPNRRSALKIREYFLANSKSGVSFLPKIIALGELNEDDFDHDLDSTKQYKDILPAISSEKRLFIISKLIRDNANRFNLEKINFEASLKLAASLATLLGDMQKYNIEKSAINDVLPEELSAHKQISLQFINYILDEYPKILAENNLSDSTANLNSKLALYSEYIKTAANSKIFMAGSTGSIPATRTLIKNIFNYANGFVILPYTDIALSNFDWLQIGDEQNATHNQKQLYKLLDTLELNRNSIENIVTANESREGQVSDIFRPATTISNWHNARATNIDLDWLNYIEAENMLAEAKIISVIINQKLQEEKSVAIVTNNKNLIGNVSQYLHKFNIDIDDSFGESLATSAEAQLFLKAAEVISSGFSMMKLLNILKSSTENLKNIYELEKFARKHNIKTLSEIFNHADINKISAEVIALLNKIEKTNQQTAKENDMGKLLESSFELVETLFPNMDISGNDNWRSINELLINFNFHSLRHSREGGNPYLKMEIHVEKDLFANSISFLLSTKKIWQKYKFGKTVVALSPIEARLQNFDCVIIADLVQGSWPDEKFSPWLSKNMFKQMGFSPADDYMSLSSHDFVALLHAPQIYITKSEYKNGDLTIDSSFLIRLKTYYKLIHGKELKPNDNYNHTIENLNGNFTKSKTYELPFPKPPLEARFKQLSVTEIDKIIQNPYALYAEKILGLRKLDALERDSSVADYGSFCHKVLEKFSEAHQLDLNKVNIESFDIALNDAYKEFEIKNLANPAWKNQLNQIKHWFLEIEKNDISNLNNMVFEKKIIFNIPESDFTLICKADRIEVTKQNAINVADYKTGAFPTLADINNLRSSQLLLAAWLIKQGAFGDDITQGNLSNVVYYNFSFSGGGPEKKIYEKLDLAELVDIAGQELTKLITDIQDENKPFLINPHAKIVLRYDDYIHLERIA